FLRSPSVAELHRAISEGPAEGRRAIPRSAAIEQRSGHRRDALHRVQSVRARLSRALHRSWMGAYRSGQEGAHDLYVRLVAVHVLWLVRRRLPDAVPGTHAGLRA